MLLSRPLPAVQHWNWLHEECWSDGDSTTTRSTGLTNQIDPIGPGQKINPAWQDKFQSQESLLTKALDYIHKAGFRAPKLVLSH
jgi:hypothetical protein